MAGSVLDTSVLIGLEQRSNPILDAVIASGDALVPPLVIAELMTGAATPRQREQIGDLLQDVDMCDTSLEHWMDVGLLRQHLARNGLNVTLPDAHIAQCAIERDATLISRDAIFEKIAQHTSLRLVGA